MIEYLPGYSGPRYRSGATTLITAAMMGLFGAPTERVSFSPNSKPVKSKTERNRKKRESKRRKRDRQESQS